MQSTSQVSSPADQDIRIAGLSLPLCCCCCCCYCSARVLVEPNASAASRRLLILASVQTQATSNHLLLVWIRIGSLAMQSAYSSPYVSTRDLSACHRCADQGNFQKQSHRGDLAPNRTPINAQEGGHRCLSVLLCLGIGSEVRVQHCPPPMLLSVLEPSFALQLSPFGEVDEPHHHFSQSGGGVRLGAGSGSGVGISPAVRKAPIRCTAQLESAGRQRR
jgi:hypothetical protein